MIWLFYHNTFSIIVFCDGAISQGDIVLTQLCFVYAVSYLYCFLSCIASSCGLSTDVIVLPLNEYTHFTEVIVFYSVSSNSRSPVGLNIYINYN